jgi:lipopolysaccharide transport system ATP-binding protein
MYRPFHNFQRLRRLNTFEANGEAEDIIWAIKDVSFDVSEGEVVGIIGHNGAGKSTLLKILSRITEPTSGTAVVRGRISSLLEVGTGFHPELSGRENVYMNGTILGMTKAEIDRKFDEIVDFSGVEKFLDTPIKRYSSGMQVRLAFAVAAHLEPEILIIDEVLAVGDVEFQRKCLGKMHDVARGGRTVLFVSHNMAAIRSLCHSVILLQHGQIKSIGNSDEIIDNHFCDSSTTSSSWQMSEISNVDAIQIHSLSIELTGNQPAHRLKVAIDARSTRRHKRAIVAIDFFDGVGGWIMQAIPTLTPFFEDGPSVRRIDIEVELPPLVPGVYYVGVWFGSSLGVTICQIREAVQFTIDQSPTPGRLSPHNKARGHIVPVSRVKQVVPAPDGAGNKHSEALV